MTTPAHIRQKIQEYYQNSDNAPQSIYPQFDIDQARRTQKTFAYPIEDAEEDETPFRIKVLGNIIQSVSLLTYQDDSPKVVPVNQDDVFFDKDLHTPLSRISKDLVLDLLDSVEKVRRVNDSQMVLISKL